MFTMVRSNLKKTQEFYHGTSVCAGSTQRCEDKMHSTYTRKIQPVVYGLEQQQQQQKSNMGWLFFARYVTFYENVNV
jgi:hypothetical protein